MDNQMSLTEFEIEEMLEDALLFFTGRRYAVNLKNYAHQIAHSLRRWNQQPKVFPLLTIASKNGEKL